MSQTNQAASIARLGGLFTGVKTTPKGAPLRRDDVPFTSRELEPWVAWSVGICSALVTLVMYPQSYWLWLYIAFAGMVGKWSQVFPPRSQLQMFLRGLSLLAAGFVMNIQAEGLPGGASGLFFFWVAATSICYSFLLRAGWSWSLVVLAVIAYLLPPLHGNSSEPWLPVLAQSAFLLAFPPLVSMRFGRAMRNVEDALDETLVDRPTSLYNRAGLLRHGEQLVASCLRDKKPVSLAVFNCTDLRQVHDTYGRRAGRKALAALVRELVLIAGEKGFAARTGPMEFTLILHGIGQDRALRMIEKELGSPPRITVPSGTAEAVVQPTFMVRGIGAEPDALEDLQEEMSRHLKGDDSTSRSGLPSQGSTLDDSEQPSDGFAPTNMTPNFEPA